MKNCSYARHGSSSSYSWPFRQYGSPTESGFTRSEETMAVVGPEKRPRQTTGLPCISSANKASGFISVFPPMI